MPELPEVETVCRALRKWTPGRRVVSTRFTPSNVLVGCRSAKDLLEQCRFLAIHRLGKEIIIVGGRGKTPGRCLGVHLGMTGSLRWLEPGEHVPQDRHIHAVWKFAGGYRLYYRDPRRFGRIRAYSTLPEAKNSRWAVLGPDALKITPQELHHRFGQTRRAIKAVLLDQSVLAGMGNIYADEVLFACEIHPLTPANKLSFKTVDVLVRHMRAILKLAIRSQGSSVRDYRNASGKKGSYQLRHKVYGKSGSPCRECKTKLVAQTIGGRTTTFCPCCQKRIGK